MRYFESIIGTKKAANPAVFSMTFNVNHFDVLDNSSGVARTYKVPDLRHAFAFDPVSQYAGQLNIVATATAGTADDAQAIRNAIESAKGSTEYAAGEVVCVRIPAGTWTIDSVILIDVPRIHLVGDGQGVTIIDAASNDMGNETGIITFQSPSIGIHIGNGLTQSIAEGDTRIYVSDNSLFEVGNYLYQQKRYFDPWFTGNIAKTETLTASMTIEIAAKGTDGTGQYIDLVRPMLYAVDMAQDHRNYATDWIQDCGISEMTIRQSVDIGQLSGRHLLKISRLGRFWSRNMTYDCPIAHYIDFEWIANCRQEDSTYNNGWWRGFGGGRSYIGWWKATDCFLTNCIGTFGRHVAFQNYARACYIGQSDFQGMDLNYHNQWPGHNLIEECTLNDDAEAVTKQGEVNRDIYERIFTTIESTSPNTSALSVTDNMNTVWSCDFDGRKLGGGVFDGGLMRDFTFAYNRVMIKGDGFGSTDHSWFPAQRNPMLAFSVPSLRNKYVGNNFFITQDGFNDAHAVVRRDSHNEINTPDVHLLDNTFYNYPSNLQIRDAIGGTDSGNTWIASQAAIPAIPTAPTQSILDFQNAI